MLLHIQHKDLSCRARVASLRLAHGEVKTPAFMPVGTNGSIKAIHHHDVAEMGTRLILANTYHLYLRPGIDVIKGAGGLHRLIGWEHNILTDSGGYQIFSLAALRQVLPDGVRFRSHIDGNSHILTPAKVIELQEDFRSDILMPLDICTGPQVTRKQAQEALQTTTAWLKKSVQRWKKRKDDYQGQLFGIIQGNFHQDLRKQSVEETLVLDTPGLAIGGLSVGEPFALFQEMMSYVACQLPDDKPRYVMGIGTPDFILEAVEQGIDLFDCVYPTRTARTGTVFTQDGLLNLKKACLEQDFGPIMEGCTCRACKLYSRAYLRHMFKCGEILGAMLATEHNLLFLHNFLKDIRKAIALGGFLSFKKDFLARYRGTKNER